MSEIKGFIFDIFGVICDSYNAKWEKENISDRPDLQKDFSAFSAEVDLGRKSEEDYYHKAAAAIGADPMQVKSAMEAAFSVNRRLFQIMKRLRSGHKIAVLSDSNAVFVRDVFKKHGYPLEDNFDAVLISSETGFLKPSREAFALAVRKIGLRPGECVFVDDSPPNVKAANLFGLTGHIFENNQSFERWLQSHGILEDLS